MRPIAALLLFATGCLPPAPPSPAPDGGASPDAGPPVALRLTDLRVEALDGTAWPRDGVPRRPALILDWTAPPQLDPDGDPPVYLLAGAPDDGLLEDLAAAPLRAEHRARILPSTLTAFGARWKLVADVRSPRGEALTLAIGWLRSDLDGSPIEAPEAIALTVDTSPAGGAEVTDTWPPAGTTTVSPALDVLALRLDGPVGAVSEGAVTLLEGDRAEDAAVTPVECPAIGWPDGWCVAVTPTRPLRRGSDHRLVVTDALLDATGAPVGPYEAAFATALEDDPTPPSPRAPTSCGLDERLTELGCVLEDDERIVVRVDAAEPVIWRWSLGVDRATGVAPRGMATLTILSLPSDTAFDGALELTGTSGTRSSWSIALHTTAPLAEVAIVEVRADPLGPEPTQEYVELLNYGAVALSLDGFALTDRPDAVGDLLSGTLAPAERVLLVHERFDPEEPTDGPIPPGARIIRVQGPIGSGGIANAGEALFLRDAAGRRVSESPALAAAAGSCIVRGEGSMRDGASFAVAPCTPGTP